MSVKTCKKHANDPIFIYAQCAACEIQRYRNQVDELKTENESLRANANLHKLSMDASCYEIQEMRKDARLLDILAEAMAEVKATSDGESDQPIADIVSGCLAEIDAISSPENHS